jgi:predicted nucleotidyltransferase
LFGSKVGQDSKFSDIDVLILLNKKINTDIEKQIFDIAFEVGLRFEVVFGIVVEESKFWKSPLSAATPFYQNVTSQGMAI